MKTQSLHFLPALLIVLQITNFAMGDNPLTPMDKAAIKKFRPMVEHFLPHDYMKSDGYLLRYIRTKKYDLESGKELMQKMVDWRKENNIDNLKPDKQFMKEFPVDVEGVDKEGRPVMLIDWTGDVRKVVVAGKRKPFALHLISGMESVERKVRELNTHNNNTQWIGIYDFNKFTTPTHLCVQCLPTYLDHALAEENYYPLAAKEYFIINAPRIFQTVLRLVGPILQDTLDRITTFGSNRDEWKAPILARINADQLPPQFGGTRKK
jgi:hypothetical protein